MAGVEGRFPEGLRVLVVDDNITCLRILELLLQRCKYEVTVTQEATKALKMLTETPEKYDIVITDVHMPGMDGFQLLENIGLQMDIPVIMLSANDDYAQVLRGIKHGAVDYLIKPLRSEELKNIWQHVVRRKDQEKKKGKTTVDDKEEASTNQSKDGRSTSPELGPEPETQKRKYNGDDGDDEDGPRSDNHESSGSKRHRIVWSPNLHKKFVNAVDQLGPDKASPKKILEIMKVEWLTREHVASHLQKYRLYLKRMTYMGTMGQFANPTLSSFGAQDSSLYGSRGEKLIPYAPFTNLEPSLPNSSMGLTMSFQPNTMNGVVQEQMTTHASSQGGYMAGIPHTNQTQGVGGLPNQHSLPAQYSEYMPQPSIPDLPNYTRFIANEQNNTVTVPDIRQVPPTNFSGAVSSTEISHIQNTLESASLDMPVVAQNRRFNTSELQEYRDDPKNVVSTSIVGEQSDQWFGESVSNFYGAFANSRYGHLARINTSSGVQDTEAQAREVDALLNLDENIIESLLD